MTDRIYCEESGIYALFNFETREVRFTKENPHPDKKEKVFPPFFLDVETFYAIVYRIEELDTLRRARAGYRQEFSP